MHFKAIIAVLIFFVLGIGGYYFYQNLADEQIQEITSFEECVEAGYPVTESHPRQCKVPGGEKFTEDIGQIAEKEGLIRVYSPKIDQVVESPLQISGEAVGSWYFEATFPVILTDWDGRIIAEGYATSQGDWMTEDFVPFTGELNFEKPYEEGAQEFMKKGFIIFQKANPSGLSENDDALEFMVYFE